MIAAAPMFETLIAARGPLVMRDRNGNLPSGHTAFGPVWALNMPASSLPSDVTLQHDSFVITQSATLVEIRRNLHDLWQKYLSTLRPDPWFHVPHSEAGLSDAGILAQIKTDETTRPDQIKRYLSAQTTRLPPPEMPAFADTVRRQLAVLSLPSHARASLSRQCTDDWHLRFDEQGKLEHLYDWLENKPMNKSEQGEILSPTTEEVGGARDTTARLVALARALQLIRILLAAQPDKSAQMKVEVVHAGLRGRVLCLLIRPQDRGLGLMRLSQVVATALGSSIVQPSFESLSKYGPLVSCPTDTIRKQLPDAMPHTAPLPVGWQAGSKAALPRWTYAGTGGTDHALPFAITPRSHDLTPPTDTALVFSNLSGEDRLAYLDWLAGPRRILGFRPMFAELYLQGIEYRLLTETSPPAEQAALLQEIIAVTALVPREAVLRSRLEQLIDWIGATHQSKATNPGQYGLLSSLVDLGSTVAAGRAISGPAVLTLVRHLHPDIPTFKDEVFLAAFLAAYPERLNLHAPRLALEASYRSLSGLCDVPHFRFVTDAAAVPDLRGSVALSRVIERLIAASGGWVA
ncbi:MAG: hypothetical protein CVT70_16910 [Alphaproteobacteria bacterium HGW-Alphaproteobacteria-1]|jgi:hypothetical protein|nr:MAG: hypothetical protein CVT70_16910 [Alphaproteobacteria bacterium HGW-Alphaproteobacteria-1]